MAISNPALAKFLELASGATRSGLFLPFNEAVRWGHRKWVIPVIERKLRRELALPELRLISRNSVLEKGVFNLFESDVDLSVILPSGRADASACARAIAVVSGLRDFLPFVGELEIYEDWEDRLAEVMWRRNPVLLSRIKSLRKWRWQISALSAANSGYHRKKALRSIQRIRRSLGLAPGLSQPSFDDGREIARRLDDALNGYFSCRPEIPGHLSPGHSNYLQWSLSADVPAQPMDSIFAIINTPDSLLRLAAVLPDGVSIFPEQKESIIALRADAGISRCLFWVSLNEWLLARSVLRLDTQEKRPELRPWLNVLSSQMRPALLADDDLLAPPLRELLLSALSP
ncbi:MAG: hypothetical protein P4M08_10390 [Oligoflexia bacterium]|nr:hypothetical protein [Oligoflexia bacterium]